MDYFKGMTYAEIRPIFEKVWNQVQSFVLMDSKKEKESEKKAEGSGGKKSLEEEGIDAKVLGTKYPIVDWKTQILGDKYYYQIKRADGSVKHYKIFSAMLYEFDRQDMLDLYRLVKERFQMERLEGYDLLLWGDLKIMIEPDEEDEIWKSQQNWKIIQ
ncbi:hypothetical protein Tco_0341584 [Tanacetum coccineum]